MEEALHSQSLSSVVRGGPEQQAKGRVSRSGKRAGRVSAQGRRVRFN